MKVMKLKNMQ